MASEIKTCGSCGQQTVFLVDALFVCSSCGRLDESVTPQFENESFVGVTLQPQEDGITKSRHSVEDYLKESLECHRMQLKLPERVTEEAVILIREVLTTFSNLTRKFSRQLLSGVFLFISGRSLNFPLTTQDISNVIGIKHKYFLRNLRYFLTLTNLQIPELNLKSLIKYFSKDVIDGIKATGCDEIKGQQSFQTFVKELQSIADFVHLAKLDLCVSHPCLLSAIIYSMGLKALKIKANSKIRRVICEKHGINEKKLDQVELRFRHEMLRLSYKIPGIPTNVSIRTILEFLPCFEQYYSNIQSLHLQEGDSKNLKISSPSSKEMLDYVPEEREHPSAEIAHKHISFVQQKRMFRADNDALSERRKKRQKGFEAYLQDANNRRRSNGLKEISAFPGTTEVIEHGKLIGYIQSLPLKYEEDNISEIRRGTLNSSLHKLKSPIPSASFSRRQSVRKEVYQETDKLENLVSDEDVDEYILSPDEVLLRKLALEADI